MISRNEFDQRSCGEKDQQRRGQERARQGAREGAEATVEAETMMEIPTREGILMTRLTTRGDRAIRVKMGARETERVTKKTPSRTNPRPGTNAGSR